jgi:hypothetical protein
MTLIALHGMVCCSELADTFEPALGQIHVLEIFEVFATTLFSLCLATGASPKLPTRLS